MVRGLPLTTTLILWLTATVILSSQTVLDRVCHPEIPRAPCAELRIESGRVIWDANAPSEGADKGPYLAHLHALLAPREAPVRELRSDRGWRVIQTWGFTEPRSGLRRYYLYFFSPQGKLELKHDGNMNLATIEMGRLFRTETELLVTYGADSHTLSQTVDVWILPPQGAPKKAPLEGKILRSIEPGTAELLPGLWVENPILEGEWLRPVAWVPEFWEWVESEQRFRKRGSRRR